MTGNPGAGKSVLAASVVQDLLASPPAAPQDWNLTTYFFFEYNGDNGRPVTRDRAYRALLSHLFHRFSDKDDVLETFAFVLKAKSRHGRTIATTEELRVLLKLMAPRFNTWHIVIDAVDECEAADELLLDLDEALRWQSVRLLLFSRPNVRFLRQNMKPQQVLTINRSNNQEDLRAYFETHLDRFQKLGIIPISADVEKLTDALLVGADGMFQWAKLMVTHLQSEGLGPRQRVDIVNNLTTPENLEDMYNRILHHSSRRLVSEQAMARQIFVWIAFAKKPLIAPQLQDILTPQKDIDRSSTNEICPRATDEKSSNFETSAILVSGSLIERRWSSNSVTVTYAFIHGSVQEFFRSKCAISRTTFDSAAGSIEYFLPATLAVEAELIRACLSYMIQEFPGRPLSGNMFEVASTLKIKASRPFVEYAALHWPYHLESLATSGEPLNKAQVNECHHNIKQAMDVLTEFLCNKLLLMVWIELKYTFNNQRGGHEAINRALLCWAKDFSVSSFSNTCEDLLSQIPAFADTLITLHKLWGDTLARTPHQIWNDITAFTSSPFFVTTSAVIVSPLVREGKTYVGMSAAPLSKISRDCIDSSLIAVLTIWPSK